MSWERWKEVHKIVTSEGNDEGIVEQKFPSYEVKHIIHCIRIPPIISTSRYVRIHFKSRPKFEFLEV